MPFPSVELAETARQVLSVDQPLRPSEQHHAYSVESHNLIMCACLVSDFAGVPQLTFPRCKSDVRAKTVSLARVALDHILSDAQLVVQTMHTFAPSKAAGASSAGKDRALAEPTIEVGLRGEWEAQQK